MLHIAGVELAVTLKITEMIPQPDQSKPEIKDVENTAIVYLQKLSQYWKDKVKLTAVHESTGPLESAASSLKLIQKLKDMQTEIFGVIHGSIVVRFLCSSKEGLTFLKRSQDSGELVNIFQQILQPKIFSKHKLESITLESSINQAEYEDALSEISSPINMAALHKSGDKGMYDLT